MRDVVCCAVLCCAALCYAVLCCAVLYGIVLPVRSPCRGLSGEYCRLYPSSSLWRNFQNLAWGQPDTQQLLVSKERCSHTVWSQCCCTARANHDCCPPHAATSLASGWQDDHVSGTRPAADGCSLPRQSTVAGGSQQLKTSTVTTLLHPPQTYPWV
jgi:hypothetical protein